MADNNHGDHKHGEMDTKVQERTFEGFVRMVTWGVGLSLGTLIFIGLVNA